MKTHGAAEMLIKRRLGVFRQLVTELELSVTVTLTRSQSNRADVLTRVKSTWLAADKETRSESCCAVGVAASHAKHHMGVDRTWYLARLTDSGVSRRDAEACVQDCTQCQSVDPAPARHEPGSLGVEATWSRLAVDTTHYRGRCYLTMVDCGPSRFAIWREVVSENAASIVRVLEEVFRERGPVDELLMDNGAGFHSHQVRELCERWNVSRRFRAAHRPSGNGIVERNHRTIKRSAERSGSSPLDAVFWYNMASKSGIDGTTVPHVQVNCYKWRHPSIRPPEVEEDRPEALRVGDRVW